MKHTLTLLTALLLVPLAFLKAAEPISASVPGTRILFQGDSITDGNRGLERHPLHQPRILHSPPIFQPTT